MEIISSGKNEKRLASLAKDSERGQQRNSGERLSDTDNRRYVIALFVRLGDMFGMGKVREEGLLPSDPDGNESEMLRNWMRETKGLTSGQFAQGVAILKRRVEDAAAMGEKTWPPTAVEFVAIAERGDQACRKAELEEYWEQNQRKIVGSWDWDHGTYAQIERHKKAWLAKQQLKGYPALEDKS
jgi:hypothetical protein